MSDCGQDDLAVDYALHLLDAADQVSFETHLEDCPACVRVVDDIRESAVILSEGLEVAPPPQLRERVLAGARVTSQEPAPAATGERGGAPLRVLPGGSSDEPRHAAPSRRIVPSRRTAWPWGLAAAAAVVVGTIAGVSVFGGDDLSPTQQVIQADDAVSQETKVDGATVTLVESATLGKVVLVTEGMSAPPGDKVYQVWWVHRDGSAVSAGLMPEGEAARDAEVELAGTPVAGSKVAISVEPAGGSQQPTSDPILTLPLPS